MTSLPRLPGKRSAKKRVLRAPLLERHLAGRIAHERKPGGLPFVLQALPVSMRVAKFDGDTRVTNYERNDMKNSLDPSKPVWVVIHGRGDSEKGDNINELAYAMSKVGQVVTVDWNAMAKDNSLPLEGSVWIDRVAKWVVDQLQQQGFTADQINIGSHSWGTYLANSIAMKLGHVNTIVALDPAADGYISGMRLSDVLGNEYDTTTIDFARYSNHSIAIHSSLFGSEQLARTANQTISLTFPENYASDGLALSTVQLGYQTYGETCREHGFAVTAFSAMLEKALIDPGSAAGRLLPLKQLADNITVADDTTRSSYTVAAIPHFDGTKKWWKAYPDMNLLNPNTSW